MDGGECECTETNCLMLHVQVTQWETRLSSVVQVRVYVWFCVSVSVCVCMFAIIYAVYSIDSQLAARRQIWSCTTQLLNLTVSTQ
jgi:hypothetical protein